MAKIMIYEDNESDLINRYSGLTSKHDVHVRAGKKLWDELVYLRRERETDLDDELKAAGFDINKICELSDKIEEADIYFTDGLSGGCFYWLGKLSAEKIFLNTDNSGIELKAKEKGYEKQILTESPLSLVERLLKEGKIK
jgi:hypothetical protein